MEPRLCRRFGTGVRVPINLGVNGVVLRDTFNWKGWTK